MRLHRKSLGLLAAMTLVIGAGSFTFADELDDAIREHRMGTIRVEAAPGQEVRVEQLRHEFWFGAALASQMFGRDTEDARKYKEVFLENFNSAVTENALKWHSMERTRGQVRYETVDAILAWSDEHDIPLRGHNIFWGVPNFVQPWLKEMDDATLRKTLVDRAHDVGRRYKDRFVEYDLNNEMIHGNYYADRLGEGITGEMVEWVHAEDPSAVLFLNDYDILTGRRVDDYVKHIRSLLDSGVAIGGIGVQGHLHGESFDPAAVTAALDKLAVFDLPIRITEFNIPGQRSKYYNNRDLKLSDEDEQAKAKNLVEYYRVCFAHPAVDGILMWGFWEGANWIPQSSLYKRDWTPTPAAGAYHDLVYGQWWTDWKGQADAKGCVEVPAFYGKYRVVVGDQERIVDLKSDGESPCVSFR